MPARIALPNEPACPVHHGTAMPCPHCVAPGDQCPRCGETQIDRLVWNADENVECTTCGQVYRPAPDTRAANPGANR